MQSENSIQFKAFVMRDGEGPEVRRFAVDRSVVTSYEYVVAKIQSIFPSLGNSLFALSWKDNEGDEIIISSDDELILALSSIPDDVKKIYIKKRTSGGNTPDINTMRIPFSIPTFTAAAADRGTPFDASRGHPNVVCDACQGAVVGYRYKCVVCDDYDLCSACEGRNQHSEHFMIRIPVPIGPLGSRFSRVVGHKLFKSLKKARAFDGDNDECAFEFKRYRKDDRHPSQEHEENRHGECRREGKHGEGRHGGRHGRPEREHHEGGRTRGRSAKHCDGRGWFNTFATYMNEFANLAGDFTGEGQNANQASAQTTTQTTAQTAAQTTAQASAQTFAQASTQAKSQATAQTFGESNAATANTASQASAPPADGTGDNSQNGNVPTDNYEELRAQYLMKVGKTIARILDPLGIDVDIDVRSKNKNVPQDNESAGTTSENVPKQNEATKKPEYKDTPIIDLDDNSSSSDESVESVSGARGEGWTMLNDEPMKDTSSGPKVDTKKIGFDLDKMAREFHKHVELHSQGVFAQANAGNGAATSSNTGIYPIIQLPDVFAPQAPQIIPTHLMDICEPVPQPEPIAQIVPPSQNMPPSVPVIHKPPVTQDTPPKLTYRPSRPDTAAAFDRLLAMGFKDDDGRLARLVEAKNGNIGDVLDVLTMNIPF